MDNEELLQKQLPHSVVAEQAVLGSMLIDSRCVPEVIDKLKAKLGYEVVGIVNVMVVEA